MADPEDVDRLEKLISSGWDDEESKLMMLTEGQIVLLGEDLIGTMQKALGPSVGITLSVDSHVTLLSDNTIIVEGRGRVER